MRLNKKVQYGLLLSMYVGSNEKPVSSKAAAEYLKVPLPFLRQVASELKASNILISIKGNKGGYTLNGNPTIEEIIDCLGCEMLLSTEEFTAYAEADDIVKNSLASWVLNFFGAMKPFLTRGIKNLVNETTINTIAAAAEHGKKEEMH